jgi:cytochrome c oxidase assembly protein Cox11
MMQKKVLALVMAMAFTAASAVVAYSFTCEVSAIDGTSVTLKCKQKYMKKLEVGKKVKVSAKKRKAVEGC